MENFQQQKQVKNQMHNAFDSHLIFHLFLQLKVFQLVEKFFNLTQFYKNTSLSFLKI